MLMGVSLGPRCTGEASDYNPGHEVTSGNGHNSYENLVKYVCFWGDMFKNKTLNYVIYFVLKRESEKNRSVARLA